MAWRWYDVIMPFLHDITTSAVHQVSLTCSDPAVHSGKLAMPSPSLLQSTRKQRFDPRCGET